MADQVTIEESPSDAVIRYGRDSFLRSPDWRYAEAVSYCALMKQGIQPPLPTDAKVLFAIRMIRGNSSPAVRAFTRAKYASSYDAFYLGSIHTTSPLRLEVESAIINAIPVPDIQKHIPWITPVQYAMYRDMFFDLEGVTAVIGWVNHFLFDSVSGEENRKVLRSRLLSYYKGHKESVDASGVGRLGTAGRSFLKMCTENEQAKKIYDYVSNITDMPLPIYAEFVGSLCKQSADRDFTMAMQKSEQDTGELKDLADNIEESVRGFTEAEINLPDTAGLEFSNKYTRMILEKEAAANKSNAATTEIVQ